MSPTGRGYHHGNLRAALVEAGVALARTGGPAAVVLRAVSREAGVSHNAAYRHFADHEDLLAAVSARCMEQLGRLMVERTGQVNDRGAQRRAWARMGAIGRAYLEFARTEPGWFRTAFSGATPHAADGSDSDADHGADAVPELNPYLLLSARLDELVEAGALPPQRRYGAEYAAWSAVHGLACLLLDGPLRGVPEAEADRAGEIVLSAITRGL